METKICRFLVSEIGWNHFDVKCGKIVWMAVYESIIDDSVIDIAPEGIGQRVWVCWYEHSKDKDMEN